MLLRRTCAGYLRHLSAADRRKECNGKVTFTPLHSRTIVRHWNAGCYFPQIKGELEVLTQLPAEQVEQWLTGIAAATEAK